MHQTRTQFVSPSFAGKEKEFTWSMEKPRSLIFRADFLSRMGFRYLLSNLWNLQRTRMAFHKWPSLRPADRRHRVVLGVVCYQHVLRLHAFTRTASVPLRSNIRNFHTSLSFKDLATPWQSAVQPHNSIKGKSSVSKLPPIFAKH